MTAVSPPRGRLGGLDTIRGLAAVAVLLCHVAGYWAFMQLPGKLPQLFALGAHGVDVFIVISGFVLFYPVLRAAGDLDPKQFFGRRALRILPAYYVALAIAAVLAMNPATARMVVADPASWGELALHILGIQTWFPGSLGTINGSLWSVSLELHLYLVFPLLVMAWRKWGIYPLLAFSVSTAFLWDLTQGGQTYGELGFALGGGHALPSRLVQFVAGMWAAQWLLQRGVPAVRPISLLTAGSLVLAVLASSTDQSQAIRNVVWGLLGVTLVLLTCAIAGRQTVPRLGEGFGERAYSFYLLHQPIVLLLSAPISLLEGWVLQLLVGSFVAFVLTTLGAAFMYRFVEWPTHQLGRRMFPSPSRATSAEPATTGDARS